jgi:hypothetical protein
MAAGWREQAEVLLALRAFRGEIEKFRRYQAWWALNDPVAYVWLCRAERRGARVPWSDGAA